MIFVFSPFFIKCYFLKDSKQQSKFHKPRQERIDEMLAMLRTCSAAVDENLADILGKPYQHPRLICDAKLLLSQVVSLISILYLFLINF